MALGEPKFREKLSLVSAIGEGCELDKVEGHFCAPVLAPAVDECLFSVVVEHAIVSVGLTLIPDGAFECHVSEGVEHAVVEARPFAMVVGFCFASIYRFHCFVFVCQLRD